MLAVNVLVQAIVIAWAIAQQERRRPLLTRVMATRAERFVLGGVADGDAHGGVPTVGDRGERGIETAAKRHDQVRQRVGEILVLAPAEAVFRHHDTRAEEGVVLVQRRETAAGLSGQELRRDCAAERAEFGLKRRPVQRVDDGAELGGRRVGLCRERRHQAASRSSSLRLRSTPHR